MESQDERMLLATALAVALAARRRARRRSRVRQDRRAERPSGLYSDIAGQGSVVAAKMAVEDFGAATKGIKVEIDLGRPPEQARHRLAASPANGTTRTAST